MNKNIIINTLILLTGCGIASAYATELTYLTEETHIDFSVDTQQPSTKTQQSITSAFEENKNWVWFNLTPEALTANRWNSTSRYEIKNQQIEIEGITYSLKTENNGKTLSLVSEPKMACGFFDCVITLKLQQVDDSTPGLQKIKSRFAEQQQKWQTRLTQEREQLAALVQKDDFPGVVFSVTPNLAIKLPLSIYNSLDSWNSGAYFRRMGNKGLYINIKDEGTHVYSFTEHEKTAPDHKQSEMINGEIFVVKTAKDPAYLDRWLASQKGILFRTDNGAVYYNEDYTPEAVYFQYDDVTGTWLVARANAVDGELTTVARAWAIVRTMEPQYRGKDVLSLADLSLPEKELESRYQTSMNQLFDVVETQRSFEETLTPLLEKPQRFIKPLSPRMSVKYNSSFSNYIYVDIKVHHTSLDELMAKNQQKYPNGKRLENLFIFTMNGDNANYSWYYRLADNLTLEFPARQAASLESRLLLAQVFKHLDFSKLPKIPASEKKNLFKYNPFVKAVADIGFEVDDGLIDNDGNLLIPMPKNGKYSFEWQSPYIVATFVKSVGEGVYRRTDQTFTFDRHGKAVKKP